MSINTVFEWNDQKFSFDLEDADDVERFENALTRGNEAVLHVPEGESDSECIRRECAVLRGVFEDIFGEGTAEAMFGKRNNLRIMYEAFDALVDFIAQQRNSVEEERNARFERMDRFSPARAERSFKPPVVESQRPSRSRKTK